MTKSTFLPLDEWVYYRIYCNENVADKVLNHQIKKIINHLKINKLIKDWFFIRYYDKIHHLRIRFRISNRFNFEAITYFNQEINLLLYQYQIWKVEIGSYEREVKRYSFLSINVSEKLFNIDSDFYIKNINMLNNDEQRLFYNLINTFNFIKIFYKTKKDILAFIKKEDDFFKNEFNLNSEGKKSISKKYRELKDKIIDLLDGKSTWNKYIFELSYEKNSIIDDYLKSQKKIQNEEKKSRFISSHIHMNTNRLFLKNQRLYEMITYDFLYRYYYSNLNKK